MVEKDFKCIKAMINDDYERWLSIRTVYKPFLDEGAYRSDIKYMTHNYSTHCINIYRNIDKLINWGGSSKLSTHEAFLLNTAVIVHDIYMAIAPEKRLVHSKEAYELILNEINSNTRNVINSHLKASEAEQIAEIVLGHSDLKVDGEKENTLEYLLERYKKDPDYEENRICHLAAVLRLADELDVTQDRINRNLNEMNFDLNDENDAESSRHYRKLQLVKRITENIEKNDELIICINDRIYGVENNEDIDLLAEVKNKIEEELKKVDKIYLAYKQEVSPYKRFLYATIQSEDATREKEINDYAEKNKKKIFRPRLFDKELEKKITNIVLENEMLVGGHYEVNGKVCSRDWIDTRRLIQIDKIFNEIVDSFEEKIISNVGDEKIIIFGVGQVGLRIGTILAVRFNLPFVHVIPKHLEQYYDEHDTRKVNIEQGKKYIIITDVVITGLTVLLVCEKYNIELKNVIGVYSIFLRNCNRERIKVNEQVLNIVKEVNNEFDAELRYKSSCKLWKEHKKCICNNKIIV